MTDLTEQLAIAERRIADQDRLIAHLRTVKGEMEREAMRANENAKAQAERIRELEGEVEWRRNSMPKASEVVVREMREAWGHDPSDVPVTVAQADAMAMLRETVESCEDHDT